MKKILVICTTDSMIWNFLVPHIEKWNKEGFYIDCVCSKTGFYFDDLLNKYNFNMKEIPFSRNPFKIVNYTCFKILREYVNANDYQAIICQEPVGGVMGRLVGIKKKIKVIYTAHGFHFYKGAPLKYWVLFYPVEKLLSYFTDVLVTSNEEDFQLSKKFHAKKNYKIDGVGIDLKKVNDGKKGKQALTIELGLPNNSFLVLNASELIPRKNHVIAIKAFAKANIKNSYFLICGDGEQNIELHQLVRELNIENQVKFLGFRKDLNELYNIADLFLFPSLQEGLSVALLGAMAAKLPVVCSNIRGNVDLIDDNKGGYLYGVNDIEGFVNGIRNIYNGSGKNFGEYNCEKVKQYDVEKVVCYMNDIVKGEL